MIEIAYATTNEDKFQRATVALASAGITLTQKSLELTELQSLNGAEIAADKAKQAYQQLKTPIMVSDDTWIIPALNGFPGPYMKACNHYLTAQDWLKLMADQSDKAIILHSYLAITNGKTTQVFKQTKEAYFLAQSQGQHLGAPHLQVIAWQNQTNSVAQEITSGITPSSKQTKFWKNVAEYLNRL